MAAEPKGPKGLRLDFAGGAVGYRFRRGGERGHPLVKAAGLKKDRGCRGGQEDDDPPTQS